MRARIAIALIAAGVARHPLCRRPPRFQTRSRPTPGTLLATRCRRACASSRAFRLARPLSVTCDGGNRSRWRSGTGVRDAKTWGNVCVQPNQPNRQPVNVTVDLPDSPKMSEDCLYLNVWTQANRANDRRPVMLWIFGGAYSEGGG